MWTRFMDMHSGGGLKDKWPLIYIEADEETAKRVFYSLFGHNPERVSCTCCGSDYSISEAETLEQASGYDRGCDWTEDGEVLEQSATSGFFHSSHPFVSFADFLAGTPVGNIDQAPAKIVWAADISEEARTVDVPEQGYVWQG